MPVCRTHGPVPSPEKAPSAATSTARATARPGAFYKPAVTNRGLLANADPAYAEAYVIRAPAADVLIVTAKARTFAPGTNSSPWPATGENTSDAGSKESADEIRGPTAPARRADCHVRRATRSTAAVCLVNGVILCLVAAPSS